MIKQKQNLLDGNDSNHGKLKNGLGACSFLQFLYLCVSTLQSERMNYNGGQLLLGRFYSPILFRVGDDWDFVLVLGFD